MAVISSRGSVGTEDSIERDINDGHRTAWNGVRRVCACACVFCRVAHRVSRNQRSILCISLAVCYGKIRLTHFVGQDSLVPLLYAAREL